MPKVADLVEVGMTPLQAKHLGAQPILGNYNTLTAAGNNSQADAYQIEANYNIFSTVGATTNSAKMPLALSDAHGVYYILNSGANALNLFPAVGDNFNNLAANTAVSIPVNYAAILVKQTDISWQLQHTSGAVSNSGTNTGDVTLAGTPDYITIAGQVITRGLIDLTTDVTGDLPFANLAQGSARSVLGVTGNATADNASIQAGTDHQVLRRSGTSVAFGAVNLGQAAAITGTLPVGNGGTGLTNATIAFGAYTPTRTNVTNVASSTAYAANYMRVGTVCTVSGKIDVDPTAASVLTQVDLSLPIASNFASEEQCCGAASAVAIAASGGISGSVANDRAVLRFTTADTANRAWFYTYTYSII